MILPVIGQRHFGLDYGATRVGQIGISIQDKSGKVGIWEIPNSVEIIIFENFGKVEIFLNYNLEEFPTRYETLHVTLLDSSISFSKATIIKSERYLFRSFFTISHFDSLTSQNCNLQF